MNKAILNFIISGTIGMVALVGFEYLFYKVLPTSYWVEYTSVSPLQESFTPTEDLVFVSVSNIKRPVSLEWNDILYCNEIPLGDEDFNFVSSQNTNKTYTENNITGEIASKAWSYLSARPQKTSSCFLLSTISPVVGNNTSKKPLQIISPQFTVYE